MTFTFIYDTLGRWHLPLYRTPWPDDIYLIYDTLCRWPLPLYMTTWPEDIYLYIWHLGQMTFTFIYGTLARWPLPLYMAPWPDDIYLYIWHPGQMAFTFIYDTLARWPLPLYMTLWPDDIYLYIWHLGQMTFTFIYDTLAKWPLPLYRTPWADDLYLYIGHPGQMCSCVSALCGHREDGQQSQGYPGRHGIDVQPKRDPRQDHDQDARDKHLSHVVSVGPLQVELGLQARVCSWQIIKPNYCYKTWLAGTCMFLANN